MGHLERTFLSRVRWGNLGRLLAVATAATLLLFGSQLSHVFSGPELPARAGRPVKPTMVDSRPRTGHARSGEKPEAKHSTTRSQVAGHLFLDQGSPQGERRAAREKNNSENSLDRAKIRSCARYGRHRSDIQPATPNPSLQTQEFTPG